MASSGRYDGPWIASFRDGPLADRRHDRAWALGPAKRVLYFAKHPTRAGEWMLVGFESLVPAHPWPDQIAYRLVEVVAIDGEPVAYYELVADAR